MTTADRVARIEALASRLGVDLSPRRPWFGAIGSTPAARLRRLWRAARQKPDPLPEGERARLRAWHWESSYSHQSRHEKYRDDQDRTGAYCPRCGY